MDDAAHESGIPANPYLQYLGDEYGKQLMKQPGSASKTKSKSATRTESTGLEEEMGFDPPEERQGLVNKKAQPLKQIGRVFGFISNKSQKRQRSARQSGAEKKEKKKEARWVPDR